MTNEKIQENKLRRMARRQNLLLRKSRRRDARAADFGTFSLVDGFRNTLVADGLALAGVEDWLTSDRAPRPTGDRTYHYVTLKVGIEGAWDREDTLNFEDLCEAELGPVPVSFRAGVVPEDIDWSRLVAISEVELIEAEELSAETAEEATREATSKLEDEVDAAIDALGNDPDRVLLGTFIKAFHNTERYAAPPANPLIAEALEAVRAAMQRLESAYADSRPLTN